MGILGWILLGLIAGAIAKLILPGRQPGGWIVTILVGILGALLGGWLGSLLFDAPLEDFFSIQTWLLAIGGSLLVLIIFGLLFGRRRV
ncbi:GlsB/YeaQ/YmgE family stress response membrane protein [Homoserinibacter sp. GY 40078]|uniref:GlsB/YeaQ/YmgE family stress response membrane protein n=1 Tax=Homoserinibacter sp. GY 40078 TaxID=2603275 RepID=UPI0011CBD070|nr:GlsB/YeaQ/YmgE family stress response membrane protein [Homoserinibacter sp. GY 40078]TXK17622.1 GlsB/YeaQ/YmgE family stress response membrane protein [Homoserinibacter sp. GY 40078]